MSQIFKRLSAYRADEFVEAVIGASSCSFRLYLSRQWDDPKITMFVRTWRLIDDVDGCNDGYERTDRDVPVNSIDAT